MIAQRIPVLSGGFSLAAFMAQQSDGFWYDFTQTDRLFQETTGPTPANDPGEDIGLALSSRLWNGASLAAYVAGQPELVTNGGFDTDITGWVTAEPDPNAVVKTWDAGRLRMARGTGSNSQGPTQAVPTVAGRLYALTFTSSGASVAVRVDSGVMATAVSGIGTFTYYFTATGSTASPYFWPTNTSTTAFLDNVSVREVSRYPATQATASFKPKYQTAGAAFDGADDNLLTGYTAGSGANFLVAKVVVPASIAATQVICGAWVAGPTEFFFLGLSTTGLVRCGVGGVAATASAGSDLRGTEAVIGLSFDATTVRMFAGGAEVNSAPRSGNPTTVTPVCIGATNAAGSASNPFGGSVKSIVAGRQFLDLSTFNKIAAAL